MSSLRFTKMHGAGNDYIYLDGFRDALPTDPSALAVQLSNRHTGIGGDGLILICPSDIADAEMRMFNADGSSSEMCGNGIRCVAKYLFDHGIVPKKEMSIATGDGIKSVQIVEQKRVSQVRVDMGPPELDAAKVPTLLTGDATGRVVEREISIGDRGLRVTCVSMGNPHCVIFVEPGEAEGRIAKDELVQTMGPQIERDPRFPSRTNVEFVVLHSANEVSQRTWERGSGETLACGTGASAVCVAGVLTGRTDRVIACHLTGGLLQLEWDEVTNHVFMLGPAVEVFRGEI